MKEPQLSQKERRVGVATAFHGQKGNAAANFRCHTRPYWGHCAMALLVRAWGLGLALFGIIHVYLVNEVFINSCLRYGRSVSSMETNCLVNKRWSMRQSGASSRSLLSNLSPTLKAASQINAEFSSLLLSLIRLSCPRWVAGKPDWNSGFLQRIGNSRARRGVWGWWGQNNTGFLLSSTWFLCTIIDTPTRVRDL